MRFTFDSSTVDDSYRWKLVELIEGSFRTGRRIALARAVTAIR